LEKLINIDLKTQPLSNHLKQKEESYVG